MLRTSTIIILGCSITIVRAFNRYLFLMKDIFHVSSNYISFDYCCVTFVSLFNLRQPRDFTTHTARRGTLYIFILPSSCTPGSVPIFESQPDDSIRSTRYQVPGTTFCSILQQYYIYIVFIIFHPTILIFALLFSPAES